MMSLVKGVALDTSNQNLERVLEEHSWYDTVVCNEYTWTLDPMPTPD